MKKVILSINSVDYGSTGRIMRGISKVAEENGYECWQAYAPNKLSLPPKERDIIISPYYVRRINERVVWFTGMRGFYAYFSTILFLKKIKKISPDIIHLHNLHDNYINIRLLFNYIKKNHIKVVWTLHDCWAFTGRCPHFLMSGCDKWKTGCKDCIYPLADYPSVRVDRTKRVWEIKKKIYSNIEKMVIVTPSKWLSGLVGESILKEYSVSVINNGIDLNVFYHRDSSFRSKYGIGKNDFVILGVSLGWNNKKGLDIFIELAKKYVNKYKIVLVGTDEEVDKYLPSNIISIHKTQDANELAEIYSGADVFLNPTREDNFPTVNIEAMACGTIVVTSDVGGSAEMICEGSGFIVKNNYSEYDRVIKNIYENYRTKKKNPYNLVEKYNMFFCYKQYVELYDEMI